MWRKWRKSTWKCTDSSIIHSYSSYSYTDDKLSQYMFPCCYHLESLYNVCVKKCFDQSVSCQVSRYLANLPPPLSPPPLDHMNNITRQIQTVKKLNKIFFSIYSDKWVIVFDGLSQASTICSFLSIGKFDNLKISRQKSNKKKSNNLKY